jgi:hypothetical protein
MNVITNTIHDLLSPNTPENLAGLSKQFRLIKELYSVFPDILVAGGAPFNSFFRVKARDIDIFCISEETAYRVRDYLDGIESSKIFNYEVKDLDLTKVAVDTTTNPYPDNMNKRVLSFIGKAQQQRSVFCEINVIVRKAPAGTTVLFREQLAALYLVTTPSNNYSSMYLEDGNGNMIVTRPKFLPSYVGRAHRSDANFNKTLVNRLALAAGFYRKKKTIPRKHVDVMDHLSQCYIPLINSEATTSAEFRDTTYWSLLFYGTGYTLSDLLGTAHKVGQKTGMVQGHASIREPFCLGMGASLADEDVAEYLQNNGTYEEKYDSLKTKALNRCAEQGVTVTEREMYTLWTRHRNILCARARSRSPNWKDTLSPAPELQSDRGQANEPSAPRPTATSGNAAAAPSPGDFRVTGTSGFSAATIAAPLRGMFNALREVGTTFRNPTP